MGFADDNLVQHQIRSPIRRLATGQSFATLQHHMAAVTTVAFSPDGSRMLTASWDDTARVFRVGTLSEIAQLLAQ